MYTIKKTWNPDIFQGKHKKRKYFEGWYFKLIDRLQNNVLAVIPGVSFGGSPRDAHAFVQLIDAIGYGTHYFKYDISEFRYREDIFEIEIAGNLFNKNTLVLNLGSTEAHAKGELHFHHIVPFPKTFTSPGIMGPFSFIPFMECYHGVVNIHHEIEGSLEVNGKTVDFGGGYGYIEKDWGRSFPESWVWLQSNHFEEGDVSVMFFIAKIPWLGSSFPGFISFLRIKERFYRFATYTGAKIRDISLEGNMFDVLIEDAVYKLHLHALHSGKGLLKAPKNGLMECEITESISEEVCVSLLDKRGNTIFEGKGMHTGIEIVDGTNLLKKR